MSIPSLKVTSSKRIFFYLIAAITILLTGTARAQLTYPPFLMDELSQSQIGPDTKKVIVLIHGWTFLDPDNIPSDYLLAQTQPAQHRGMFSSPPWSKLRSYLTDNKRAELKANGWKVLCYHWEKDASTGGVFYNGRWIVENANNAALNAVAHGAADGLPGSQGLGSLLKNKAPNLREVHFIAHSAGAWVAREAMRTLMQANSYVVCQMTLLDPYIPGIISGEDLSETRMSDTLIIPGQDMPYRIHRLDNYYAKDDVVWDPAYFGQDAPTPNTQHVFTWNSNRDINQRVDHFWLGILSYFYYSYHGGPIEFYGDTIASSGGFVTDGLTIPGVPFDYQTVGYYRSLFFQDSTVRPRITAQPESTPVPTGQTITLTVAAVNNPPFDCVWYKNGTFYQSTGSSGVLTISNASTSSSGTYIARVSNNAGLIYSDAATVTVTSGPPPTPPPGSPVAPTVQTLQPTNVTSSSAMLQGKINYTGGADIVEARFEWTANTFPGTPVYNVPISGSNFSYTLTGLQPNTQYTYHAYAKNAAGLWNANPNNVSFITPQPSTLPNIAPFQSSGWSDKIVVSRVTGTNTDSSGLLPTDALYVDWGMVNTSAATTGSFYSQLFVDNVLRNTWITTPMPNGNVQTVSDFPIGSLSSGTHFITIRTDVTGLIPENNENDNDYTRSVVIGSPTPTPTPSPSATPPGYLVVNPTNFSVGSGFGANFFDVTNTGAGGLTWSGVADSWITLTASNGSVGPAPGYGLNRINFSYLLNASTLPRTGTITITAPGAINSPQRIYIVQDGQSPIPQLPPPSPTPTPTPPGPTPTPNPISDARPDFIWATSPGFTANGIATDAFGNSYIVGIITGPITIGGQTVTPIGGTDVILAKYDAAGNFIWVRQAGGKGANWNGSDWGNGVAVDSNGNVYITGHYTWTVTFGSFSLTTGAGTTGLFVAKYDSAGNVVWLSGAVGASISGFANGQAVAVDSSGNAYATGQFTGSVAFGTTTITASAGQADIVLVKYDSSGNLVWVRQAGGSSYDQPWAITVDSSSNCYLTGYSGSQSITFGNLTVTRVPGSSPGSSMMFAAKYDSNGNVVWATQASTNSTSGNVFGSGIAVDSSGNTFVTGTFYANVVFGSQSSNSLGQADIYLCKIDSAGNPVWLWETGASGVDGNGFRFNCSSIGSAVDRNGNCYITGYFQGTVPFGSTNLTSVGGDDIFIARFNGQGSPAWAVQAGGSGDDIGFGIQVDSSGNAYVEGSLSGSGTFGSLSLTGNSFITKLGVPRYTISLNVDPPGAGVANGDGSYAKNSQINLLAAASSGFIFQGWFENGSLVWPDTIYNFSATADRSLLASFVSQAASTPPPTLTRTFTSWLQSYFTSDQLSDPSISGDAVDPDHDGLSNLLEYAFNSDPTKSSTTNRPYTTIDATYLSLIYTKVLGATDLTYVVQQSSDLLTWSPASPTNVVLADDGVTQTIKAQVPIPTVPPNTPNKLFLRLSVSH
jgi:hypothetical protein